MTEVEQLSEKFDKAINVMQELNEAVCENDLPFTSIAIESMIDNLMKGKKILNEQWRQS